MKWFAKSLILGLSVLTLPMMSVCLVGQDTTQPTQSEDEKPPEWSAEEKAKFEKLEKLLTGAKLVGSFTVKGADSTKLNEETYFIKKVTKLDKGDYFLFEARIKYGKNDYTVPLALEVKWAGDTPMITLTDFKILGQGPFGARVVFHDGMYAGTWSHGEVGGHLFGRIERDEMSKKDESAKEESPKETPK